MASSNKFENAGKKLEKYKNKNEFINYIEYNTKVKLDNSLNPFNKKRNVLYTNINENDKNVVLGFLKSKNKRYENHTNNNYFIYLN
jgi:hypothetical protein